MNTISDDILRHVLGFCDTNRYLTLGIVNRRINSLHREEEKNTSTMGFLESDTMLVGETGKAIFPGNETAIDALGILARSKHSLRLIDRALDRGLEWDHFCVEEESSKENKDFFIWLSNSDLFWLPENAYAAAAYDGKIDMMDYLLVSGFGYPDNRCKIIARGKGDTRLDKWIERVESTDGFMLSDAVKNDNIRTVVDKFEEKTYYNWILHDAVMYGSFSVVEFLLGEGIEPTQRDFNTAREMSREKILEILTRMY